MLRHQCRETAGLCTWVDYATDWKCLATDRLLVNVTPRILMTWKWHIEWGWQSLLLFSTLIGMTFSVLESHFLIASLFEVQYFVFLAHHAVPLLLCVCRVYFLSIQRWTMESGCFHSIFICRREWKMDNNISIFIAHLLIDILNRDWKSRSVVGKFCPTPKGQKHTTYFSSFTMQAVNPCGRWRGWVPTVLLQYFIGFMKTSHVLWSWPRGPDPLTSYAVVKMLPVMKRHSKRLHISSVYGI